MKGLGQSQNVVVRITVSPDAVLAVVSCSAGGASVLPPADLVGLARYQWFSWTKAHNQILETPGMNSFHSGTKSFQIKGNHSKITTGSVR